MTTPIQASLKSVSIVITFMNANMGTIIAFLAILSTQLIYSLMLSDVEEKTYEFGMLRALGFNTDNVIITIMLQAVTFIIPGVILGLLLSSVLNCGLRYVLYSLTNNFADYYLSQSAIILGVTIGVVLPVISNILPIQNALGKNLRSSLDLYHKSGGELTV